MKGQIPIPENRKSVSVVTMLENLSRVTRSLTDVHTITLLITPQ